MKTKNLYKLILPLIVLLFGASLQGKAQGGCADCAVEYTGGQLDLNNSKVCVTTDVTLSLGSVNGSNNVICIAPGVVLTYEGNDVNVNNHVLSFDVQGTLHFSNEGTTRVGAVEINVASGGSVTNAPGAMLILDRTRVNNHGVVDVQHLENSHTDFVNYAEGKLMIQGTWWQHGGLKNFGLIETQCGITEGAGSLAACEFLVGDKDANQFQNEGTIRVKGPIRVEGQVNTGCNSKLIAEGENGNIQVSKPIIGGGSIIGKTGTFSNDGIVKGAVGKDCRPQVYFSDGPNNGFNNTPQNPGTDYPGFDINTSLPVTLVDFNAKVSESIVELNWSTSSEDNSSIFIVERSNDAQIWSELATVNASGNTSQLVKYSYRDVTATKGNVWYYRLKMVDLDGSHEYSGLRSVQYGLKVTRGILYPNPTAESLFIEEAELSRIDRIYIYNKLGKVVKAIPSVTSSSIDISGLNPDAYIVRILYKDNTRSAHNIVVSGK